MKIERRLTETDKALLESYKYKCKEVKDFTAACLKGTHTGLLLFGAGGNGKSYSIRETLQERKIKEIQPEDTQAIDDDDEMPSDKSKFGHDTFIVHQGRVTPKGLIDAMYSFPSSLHLVEDAETMFDDKNVYGVLRMSLHSQDHSLHPKRRITWKTSVKTGSFDFWFDGALVIVGNRLLDDRLEEMKAVMTRCPCMNFDISNDELIAKMKELCDKGYGDIASARLTRDDCYSVLEFILDAIESDPALKRDGRGVEKKLNMRILISGFRFLAFGRMEHGVDWKAMLLSQLKQQVGAKQRTRKDRLQEETAIAKEIAGKRWGSQQDKLVAYYKAIGADAGWADADPKSDVYRKGFNKAKTEFSRRIND
jgi:hypothetical protein